MQKVYGVLRVFNTLTNGSAVAGLEAGSAVLSTEATKAGLEYYPNALIAITNHHVVGEQRNVMLNFYFNENPFPASVIKVFPQLDIAFLHIDITTPEFQLANIDKSGNQRKIRLINGCSTVNSNFEETLQKVVAVGYPLGTSHQTISQGYITAIGKMSSDNQEDIAFYHDCVINPGNSGGALLKDGKLIGINTAIMDPSKFNTVSISRPYKSIEHLFQYIAPDNMHEEFDSEEYRQLMSKYHIHEPLQNLLDNFEAHFCGGLKANNVAVTFADWFKKHCFNKPENNRLLQRVLFHLSEDPDNIHELRENDWKLCGDCEKTVEIKPTIINPERVVFHEFFSITPTDPIGDHLIEKYGRQGVVISNTYPHENGISVGDLLVGINGRKIDNFGNFEDNGYPYFTAFKHNPGKKVRLNIAEIRTHQIQLVDYVYDRLEELPLIHHPLLTPFNKPQVVKIGGLYIKQLDSAIAKAKYPKYLKPSHYNKVVGVVLQVDSNSSEWNILRLQPGDLLTKVNNEPLKDSIFESLKDARFLTFKSNDKTIIKLM